MIRIPSLIESGTFYLEMQYDCVMYFWCSTSYSDEFYINSETLINFIDTNEPKEILLGESFTVNWTYKYSYSGKLWLRIYKDIPLLPDKMVYEYNLGSGTGY